MWTEIKDIIHRHYNFLLTTHVNPDGDGFGAACALTELLILLGKNVRVVCDSPIPAKFSFLDFHGVHESYDCQKDYAGVEVIIVLDTHRKERIGSIASLVDQSAIITICIDHHVPTEIFTPYTVIDSKACSVGAMIYSLYEDYGFELDLQAATGIYASVLCDTGRFSYSSTTRKAHEIADECMRVGVDPDLMYSRLFQHVSLEQIRMFAKALQRMETCFDNKVVIQSIFLEDCESIDGKSVDIQHVDLEYILEFNKLIEGLECVVLLRELPNNQVRISLRSTSDLDVSQVMKVLGGGGHHKAAGATWNGSMEQVKEKVIELLDNALRAPLSTYLTSSCHLSVG